eukprot:COSAG02_NODE_19030_length_904_cov_0.998758_2_plen_150_part_01
MNAGMDGSQPPATPNAEEGVPPTAELAHSRSGDTDTSAARLQPEDEPEPEPEPEDELEPLAWKAGEKAKVSRLDACMRHSHRSAVHSPRCAIEDGVLAVEHRTCQLSHTHTADFENADWTISSAALDDVCEQEVLVCICSFLGAKELGRL